MTLNVCCVDVVLNGTLLNSLEETTLFLNLEEQLPSLLCEGIGEVLYIVRACTWVHDAVEVALFLDN